MIAAKPNFRTQLSLVTVAMALGLGVAASLRTTLGYAPPITPLDLEAWYDRLLWLVLNGLVGGAQATVIFIAPFLVFYQLKIHKRFGIFGVTETPSHFWTGMRNWKLPFLYGVFAVLLSYLYGLKAHTVNSVGSQPEIVFALPAKMIFLQSPTVLTDVLYIVGGYYLTTLTDYWIHRTIHRVDWLYNKYPFAHWTHHTAVFVNPGSIFYGPLIAPPILGVFAIYSFMLSQGLLIPVLVIHLIRASAAVIAHLGCDPLPWLSRLNHKLRGLLPWVPMFHQYHHVPFLSQGNYGPTCALWDYLFGTLMREYIHHVENDQPLPEVVDIMKNKGGTLDQFFEDRVGFNLS